MYKLILEKTFADNSNYQLFFNRNTEMEAIRLFKREVANQEKVSRYIKCRTEITLKKGSGTINKWEFDSREDQPATKTALQGNL